MPILHLDRHGLEAANSNPDSSGRTQSVLFCWRCFLATPSLSQAYGPQPRIPSPVPLAGHLARIRSRTGFRRRPLTRPPQPCRLCIIASPSGISDPNSDSLPSSYPGSLSAADPVCGPSSRTIFSGRPDVPRSRPPGSDQVPPRRFCSPYKSPAPSPTPFLERSHLLP